MEWLLGFHAEARRTRGCIESVCHAGEVLHVPSGTSANLHPNQSIIACREASDNVQAGGI